MTNTIKLNKAIKESGISITYIARKIGITREGFYKKLNNKTEFKASEISTVQQILNLTNEERDEIFFAQQVEYSSTC